MTGMAIERDFRKLALATQAELRRVATPHVKLIAVQPVVQRDRARYRPRRKALRDNRGLLRRAPAPPPRRSRQNLNPPETVPINWQITSQTSLPASTARDRIIPPPSAPARREQRFAYACSAASAVSFDFPGMLGLHSPHPRKTIHPSPILTRAA